MPSHSKTRIMQPGRCYHYYTRSNTNEKLFRNTDNFNFFLTKYQFFTNPVCRTFAYCLMYDHLHVLIQVRNEAVLTDFIKAKYPKKASDSKELKKMLRTVANKEFANLLNSYAQAFNKYHGRSGRLFTNSHRAREIKSREEFVNMIAFTHRDPVKHGVVQNSVEWAHNSYHAWSFMNEDDSTSLSQTSWLADPGLKPDESSIALNEFRAIPA